MRLAGLLSFVFCYALTCVVYHATGSWPLALVGAAALGGLIGLACRRFIR